MTNVLILYPHIPRLAKYTSCAEEVYPYNHQATFKGPRSSRLYTSEGVDATISYDLGTGATATVDFLLVSGELPTTYVKLYGDNGGGSTLIADTSAASSDDHWSGRYQEDWFSIFSTSSAYRYFDVLLLEDGVTPYHFGASHIYFGNAFDPGIEPVQPLDWGVTDIESFSTTTTAGNTYRQFSGSIESEFTIEWQLVTFAKAQEFISKIFDYAADTPIWLATNTQADNTAYGNSVFNYWHTFGCWVTDWQVEPAASHPNYYNVSMTVKELDRFQTSTSRVAL